MPTYLKRSKSRNIFQDLNISSKTTMLSSLDYMKNIPYNVLKNVIGRRKIRFHNYCNLLKNMNKLTLAQIAERSNFKTTILKDILSNRRNPSRDLVIGLSYAFSLNLSETNLFLKSAGFNDLYLFEIRDCIVIKSIEEDLSLKDTNTILKEQGLIIIGNLDYDESYTCS